MIHTTNLSRMLPKTQFLTPFTIRKCCVGNTKANEDFGEAWMFIIALVTLCLKMGITLRSFPRDSAQRRISLESHAKHLVSVSVTGLYADGHKFLQWWAKVLSKQTIISIT